MTNRDDTPKAVIFDFDYTLADSSRGLLECVRYALRTSRYPVPEERAILRTTGMSLHDTFALLAPGCDTERLRQLFKEHADRVMADGIAIFEGVPDAISALRSMGYGTGIVSTKFRYRIEAILAREKLSHLFNVIIGGEDVRMFKPDPEGLNMAIDRLGCDKKSVIYVGDTVIDAMTAEAAGVSMIAVSSGMTAPDELARYKTLRILPDVTHLPGCL